jgi:hypothetical protein
MLKEYVLVFNKRRDSSVMLPARVLWPANVAVESRDNCNIGPCGIP